MAEPRASHDTARLVVIAGIIAMLVEMVVAVVDILADGTLSPEVASMLTTTLPVVAVAALVGVRSSGK